MKPLKTLAILAALSPVSAMAQPAFTDADLDSFRAAMIAVGCMVNNEQQAAQVESATGFDREKLGLIVVELHARGEVDTQNAQQGVQLLSGECKR
ncbi:hypothetical protein [Rhodovulum strictum]|uniref:Uncharacterized protein n=1 Tax=Rhodovulum strictum TaxID=58314 RepID=A0A844BF50_9RHOB|nr:hypothetical protein [Rhodovulum strictum]MRH19975.1 hypothetical protein [Rhodovulum strictum]